MLRIVLALLGALFFGAASAHEGEFGKLFFPAKEWQSTLVPVELVMPSHTSPVKAKALMWRLGKELQPYFSAKPPKKNFAILARCTVAVDHEEAAHPEFFRFVIRCFTWPLDANMPQEKWFEAETADEAMQVVAAFSKGYFERINPSYVRTDIYA